MVQQKLKPCKHDGHLSYLWSHGYCKKHWMILTAKKQITEKKENGVSDRDNKFYRHIWNHSLHYCANCGKELREFNFDLFHHILEKSKYEDFRHDERNIILVCGKFGCHGLMESAISYPKTKVFEYCEMMKRLLLAESGIEYSPKNINQNEPSI